MAAINPKCITCGRVKTVVRIGSTLKCNACGTMFDDDPDEGGNYYADPSKRMEREENMRDRRREKLERRRA